MPLLQAETSSRQPSHAANPMAVLLAVPGAGVPGAPHRQGSGMAGELECSRSDVSQGMEGATQRVSWVTHSRMEGAPSCAQAPSQSLTCVVAQTQCRPHAALPVHAVLSGMWVQKACLYRHVLISGPKVASGICMIVPCCTGSCAGACCWTRAPRQQLDWRAGCTGPAPSRCGISTCCCLRQGPPEQSSRPDEHRHGCSRVG